MAEFPALPLFTDAFIADTLHLNAAQTGAYLMLLMVAWRTKECALPDDDKRLATFARMDIRAWQANKSYIMQFWVKGEDGFLRQKRLSDERIYVDAKRDQAAQAGRASALKRKGRHLTDVPTKPQQNVNPHTLPTPTTQKEKKEGASAFEIPDWILPTDWQDFEDHRKKLRKPMTDRARKLAVSQISGLRGQGHDPALLIQQSILRGWQSFFPLKPQEQSNGAYIKPLTKSERLKSTLDEAVAELDAADAERASSEPDRAKLPDFQRVRQGTGGNESDPARLLASPRTGTDRGHNSSFQALDERTILDADTE